MGRVAQSVQRLTTGWTVRVRISSGQAWYPQMRAENVIGRTHLVTVSLSVGKGNKYGHGQNSI